MTPKPNKSEFISIQAVKPSDKSKFICDTCGLRLTTKCALERHQMVHSDDRFWRCPICHEEFKHYHGAQVRFQISRAKI